MKENNKNNGRGIFYGVIGVATLVVAIIGATFAYFTASATASNNITGNMATISMGLTIEKVIDPGKTTGMIPMSNNMVETAISGQQAGDKPVAKDNNNTCVDDNGNAVCQIYKVTITNKSSATMFTDGYVALTGGSGTAADIATDTAKLNKTTMRWAQVFPATTQVTSGTSEDTKLETGNKYRYSTSGTQKLGKGSNESKTYNSLDGVSDKDSGHNSGNITTTNTGDVLADLAISGNTYKTVNKNFIRISDHTLDSTGNLDTSFVRSKDITSTLVLSQQLQPSTDTTYSKATYYFVVWLSETGDNQNVKPSASAGGDAAAGSVDTNRAENAANFFSGVVSFISAQGSEVTATFSGYTAVASKGKNA